MKNRTFHLLYRESTKEYGAVIAANESGRVMFAHAAQCASPLAFQLLVQLMRLDEEFPIVTSGAFIEARHSWYAMRRNAHYCNRKIAEWTMHCPHDDSTLSMLQLQAAIYHGIQNENKYD
jgi:hypothetical protein